LGTGRASPLTVTAQGTIDTAQQTGVFANLDGVLLINDGAITGVGFGVSSRAAAMSKIQASSPASPPPVSRSAASAPSAMTG
jgi:hypothetical protein